MLLRSTSAEVDVSTGQRTVTGLIAPYDTPTEVSDGWAPYVESFARGAFASALANPGAIKFLGQHDRMAMPLGRMVDLKDSHAGPVGTFRVAKTQAGDEYLELARDGAVDGLSIGFSPVDPGPLHMPKRGEQVVRKAVDVSEVSGVTWPAYADARVSEVRAAMALSELRAGKTLSASTLATLQEVLDLVAGADDNVDRVQEILADLMGVPNPDKDADTEPDADDGADSPNSPASAGGRGYSAALVARRMRVRELTSATRRATSAARNH